jgi:hypothetical protein
VPISARFGDNIAQQNKKAYPDYNGPTLLGALQKAVDSAPIISNPTLRWNLVLLAFFSSSFPIFSFHIYFHDACSFVHANFLNGRRQLDPCVSACVGRTTLVPSIASAA